MLIDPSNLCGTAEAAAVLGVLKQRIHTLRKRPDFPQPIVTLAATPIWDKESLVAFKSTWKKTTTQEPVIISTEGTPTE
jgi:hypothetical protein